jgi:hypothetical protein
MTARPVEIPALSEPSIPIGLASITTGYLTESHSRADMVSSRPTSSNLINLLSLPVNVRKRIYKPVLTIPHPLYISTDNYTEIELFAPDKPTHWLALFYTNRQICKEACEILYSSNVFVIVDKTIRQPDLLALTLNSVGNSNAALLTHLCINFPISQKQCTGELELRQDGLQTLKLLQKHSTGLKVLELFVSNRDCNALDQADPNQTQVIYAALNTQLKAIPSLKKIVLKSFGSSLNRAMVELLQSFGWVVLTTKETR